MRESEGQLGKKIYEYEAFPLQIDFRNLRASINFPQTEELQYPVMYVLYNVHSMPRSVEVDDYKIWRSYYCIDRLL